MLQRLARFCLKLAGWTIVGKKPDVPKMVITAYPHTSNWDLLFYLLSAWALRVPLSWMGKESLFRGPAGVILRRLGGIAIRRDRNENVVAQMKRRFDERDELCLLIPLEGTRRYVPYLRSGFYHIAVTAGVPIALGFLDYGEKQAGIGGLVEPTGDVRRDMDGLRDFFDGRVGLYPECAGEVRLREEDA
ncbi:MAG: 1-acyl-sn-glycerol-3-phosphate acyltransferase [Myxococcota bacterium]